MTRLIEYRSALQWTGNTGTGTSSYNNYSRDYLLHTEGKPDLPGTAGHHFRGDPTRHDPEDHFLAAIAGCHLLSYLALAARNNVVVVDYRDEVTGVLSLEAGGGKFTSVMLRPVVTIAAGSDRERALALHDTAHEQCFIANSCSVPIHHEPTIVVAGRGVGRAPPP
jgi:organic hydroperoxide reductase OsmC/OhrA